MGQMGGMGMGGMGGMGSMGGMGGMGTCLHCWLNKTSLGCQCCSVCRAGGGGARGGEHWSLAFRARMRW
jgi:hypothetical protein